MSTHLRRRAHQLAAAVVLTAAASLGVVGLSAPAQAAACTGPSGVTVVVDPHQLGGGVQQGCATGSGRASGLFASAGFGLARAQQDPGFVCRVSGAPSDASCQKATSPYWALWWSDGSSGSWVYATAGVDGLSVPSGGSFAFSWSQGGDVAPGVDPVARAAAPAPAPTRSPSAATPTPVAPAASSTPSSRATKQPSGGGRSTTKPQPSAAASTRPAATPSASSSASSSPSASAPTSSAATPSPVTPSATPTSSESVTYSGSVEPLDPDDSEPAPTGPSATAGSDPTSETSSTTDDAGLPSWLAPVLVVLVFGAAGATAVVRRRRA